MSHSPLKPQSHQTISERQALFRRFGYDSDASLAFILAKALPLPGHVLEIGENEVQQLLADFGMDDPAPGRPLRKPRAH